MSLFEKVVRAVRVIWAFGAELVKVVLSRPRTRPERAAWLSGLCTRVLNAANITYEVVGPTPMHGGVISNHLNYTDILVHAAIRPCVFVSKAELRKTPVLGWISFMAGTQYVERGAGGQGAKAAEGMAKGFRDGLPITFFPEGTTGTGEPMLMPFRSGLIAQTLEADQPIRASWLHYELSAEDLSSGKSPQRDIFWGRQTLLAHLGIQLGLRHTHVRVRFAPAPIHFSTAALADRKVAAEEAYAAVLALSEPLQT